MNNPPECVAEIPVTELGNLACPFCGGVKLSKIVPKAKPEASWIQCDRCGATGPNVAPDLTWNMRAFDERVYVRKQDLQPLQQLGFLPSAET